jgi:hypothetical protein
MDWADMAPWMTPVMGVVQAWLFDQMWFTLL